MLVPGRLDDPRVSDVAITRVETTQDLSTAKVYYICPDFDANDRGPAIALAQAAGVLRTELGSLGLRRLPQLMFTRDVAYERGERVLHILDRLGPTTSNDPAPDGPGAEATDSGGAA